MKIALEFNVILLDKEKGDGSHDYSVIFPNSRGNGFGDAKLCDLATATALLMGFVARRAAKNGNSYEKAIEEMTSVAMKSKDNT